MYINRTLNAELEGLKSDSNSSSNTLALRLPTVSTLFSEFWFEQSWLVHRPGLLGPPVAGPGRSWLHLLQRLRLLHHSSIAATSSVESSTFSIAKLRPHMTTARMGGILYVPKLQRLKESGSWASLNYALLNNQRIEKIRAKLLQKH